MREATETRERLIKAGEELDALIKECRRLRRILEAEGIPMVSPEVLESFTNNQSGEYK